MPQTWKLLSGAKDNAADILVPTRPLRVRIGHPSIGGCSKKLRVGHPTLLGGMLM